MKHYIEKCLRRPVTIAPPRNPVIIRFYLTEDIHLEKKAGMTAFCEYSLLSDNVYLLMQLPKN